MTAGTMTAGILPLRQGQLHHGTLLEAAGASLPAGTDLHPGPTY